MCSTWQSSDKRLPDTKAGLYQQFVETFYIWKENRFQQQEELNAALGRLAKRAIDSEMFRFRLRHKFVREELGDPKQRGSLFWWALQLGWLNEIGLAAESVTKEKVYAFYHPTFQEYFAALAIADWHFFLNHVPDNPVQGTYRIFEPQWKEVILLWLGREDVAKEEKEDFIQALVEFEDGCREFYSYRAYFLTAAGIAELVDVDNAKKEEIIKQIVKYCFGYLNEQYQWVTFLDPIAEQARKALQETEPKKAIKELVQLINSFVGLKREEIHDQVAKNLVQIGTGNPTAIEHLEELIESTQSDYTARQAAACLGKIHPSNQIAINKLEQLIDSTKNEFDRWVLAHNLILIDSGNPKAMTELLEIIESGEDESYGWNAVESLGEIGTANPEVIDLLEKLIQSSKNHYTCIVAAESLGKISAGNPIAIKTLVPLIKSAKVENRYDLCELVAWILVKIGTDNPKVAIAELSKFLECIEDESTLFLAADSLIKIDHNNLIAIRKLDKLIDSAKDEYTCCQAADSLVKNNPNHTEAFKKLKQLIKSAKNELTRCLAAQSLGEIDTENQEAIEELKRLINSTSDIFIIIQAVDNLMKILPDSQFAGIVTVWKDCLFDEKYKNNFYDSQVRQIYKLIWHCAQNLPYPTFYQAWHQQEGEGNTNTPITQTLNPADLPQSLQNAIANNPQLSQTIHLICIDTSKFINPDNPAAKIYTEMVKGGCPKCEDGTPKTMAELQTYWDLLESDKRVVLVFYEGKGSTSQGLSQAFLNDISKFDGAICVSSDEPKDDIPVKFFTSSQAIEDLVQWLFA
ncbi:hypothetical protein NIES4073_48050 [Kalymmatonema gypsitolerans NIES-4073]|nr:hypothetical protein NIES4073_48050 [Scytonema sp. NIES-4073]